MVDKSSMGQTLVTAWTEFGRRTAVLAGMCVAIGSLIEDCPVWVASLRGAGTIITVALLVHWFARLLAWSCAGDREESRAQSALLNKPASLEKKAASLSAGGSRG